MTIRNEGDDDCFRHDRNEVAKPCLDRIEDHVPRVVLILLQSLVLLVSQQLKELLSLLLPTEHFALIRIELRFLLRSSCDSALHELRIVFLQD